jgi:UTP--glucose-1-phosphate uridylyltransferase
MITKAIIPLAGLGRRLGPLASVIPKAMFPLIDHEYRVMPLLQLILAQAHLAGARQIGLILSAAHTEMVRRYLVAARKAGYADMSEEIEFIIQPSPLGFGDAVARGADFIGKDDFLVLLGDHLYVEEPGRTPCVKQVADAFAARGGAAMIGVQAVGAEQLPYVGTVGGEPIGPSVYKCTAFVEKPDLATARQRLRTPGLAEGEYLAHCGIYAFTPEIFDCLSWLASADRPAGQELGLADAQSILLKRHPDSYYLYRIDGKAYDIGIPANYAAALEALKSG